ncbi:MAG: T9SS type A sorting domain-containing protein, partial [Rhodothermales bacterium]|nr:T9SS type A sorting domain-containing protein [Rhodothermales bacterium]
DGAAWQNRSRTSYQVVSDPTHGLQVLGGQTDNWSAGDWSPVEQFSLFEAEGAVFQEFRSWDGASWVNTDRIVFPDQTIVTLGNRIETLTARYGELIDLYLATLLLPPNFTQQWTGSEWEFVSRQRIESYHFVSGEPAVMLFETWDQGDWTSELRLEFYIALYNNASAWRVERSALQLPEHNGWTPISIEDYSFDGRNLLIESVRRDGFVGIFQNTARISYSWIGLSVGREDPGTVPGTHELRPAYPNPFNPTTTVTYELAASDDVRVELRDMLGRLIEVFVDERKSAGSYKVLVQAYDLPSGIYAVRMITPDRVQTQLLTLVK